MTDVAEEDQEIYLVSGTPDGQALIAATSDAIDTGPDLIARAFNVG